MGILRGETTTKCQTLIACLAIRPLDVNRLVRQDIKLILVLFLNTFNSIYRRIAKLQDNHGFLTSCSELHD